MEKYTQLGETAGIKAKCSEKDRTQLQNEKNKKFDELTQVQKKKVQIKDNIQEAKRNIDHYLTTGPSMIVDEEERMTNIQANYDTAVEDIKKDHPIDEELLENLEKENEELRERAKNVTENIKNMEEQYKEKISSLKVHCEDQDVVMKDKMEGIKEQLSEVD